MDQNNINRILRRWFPSVCALLLIVFLGASPSSASSYHLKKKKKEKKETIVEKKSEYDKLFSVPHETKKGFITIHRVKGKLYFEVPLGLIGRDMLLGSTVTEISDNRNAIIGSKPTTPLHFCFEKLPSKIALSAIQTDNVSTEDEPRLQAAIRQSNRNAILHLFDIAAYNKDSTAVVIDVTDFFVSDNKLLSPFDKHSVFSSGGRKRTTSFVSSKSYIDEFKTFEDNLSVRSCLNYTFSVTGGKGMDIKNELMTVQMTRSVILLDSVPYRPRLMDSRIAIFPTIKKAYSSRFQNIREIYLANRWRVEPSDPESFMNGKMVKPVKPIVFYVDSCFPENWKNAIFEAVEQWNEPFEKIGFTEVMQAREFPKNDPAFDADNLKYSCIRYAPIAIENAMGPSWVDPRSGEILNASVYLYHDVIKLLNNWLFIQTAQTDVRVRHKLIPQEVMQEAMRYVVSHEVGHCLGFMHNMSSSAVIPVDSLRSPSFTQKHGTTMSIMDYARFNYVAQPGDFERGVRMMPPRFGPYDEFLVRWNYTPLPQVRNAEEEYSITSKWITERAGDPIYRYGKQQSDIIDPRSQTEDLGDDPVKATKYGVMNLQYILKHLNEWLEHEDEDYTYRADIYDGLLMQYLTYMLHVYHQIGGVYLHEKRVGDPVKALQSVPAVKQREALNYFIEQLTAIDWVDEKTVLKELPMMGRPSDVLRKVLMKLLMAAPERVSFSALKAEGEKFDEQACMEAIYQFVWGPLLKGKKLTEAQMSMQQQFVEQIAGTAGIRWNKNGKLLTDENVWCQLVQLCGNKTISVHTSSCWSILERMLNPVAGFEEPIAEYFVPKTMDSVCYGYYMRILEVLKRNGKHQDRATRLHCELLLHQMKNALNR